MTDPNIERIVSIVGNFDDEARAAILTEAAARDMKIVLVEPTLATGAEDVFAFEPKPHGAEIIDLDLDYEPEVEVVGRMTDMVSLYQAVILREERMQRAYTEVPLVMRERSNGHPRSIKETRRAQRRGKRR